MPFKLYCRLYDEGQPQSLKLLLFVYIYSSCPWTDLKKYIKFYFPSAGGPNMPPSCEVQIRWLSQTPPSVPHDQWLRQWPFTMEYSVTCCLSTLASLKLYRLEGRKRASAKSCKLLAEKGRSFVTVTSAKRKLRLPNELELTENLQNLCSRSYKLTVVTNTVLPFCTFLSPYCPSAATII